MRNPPIRTPRDRPARNTDIQRPGLGRHPDRHIAGLIVAVVLLNRDNRRQDAEIEKLKVGLEAVKKKVDDKVSDLLSMVKYK